ncbi:MAG: glycosyltransferase family 2 protein [Sedimentisphaerales bacterium]
MFEKEISVLIFTYNAGQSLANLLDGLQKQTVKPAQILVIDSESADRTTELAKSRNCKVITFDRTDFDHGTTRNLAVSEASSEFAVFLTQDAIPADEHMIAELVRPMQADSNIAICYGRQLPRQNAAPLERFSREFNYPARSVLKTKNDIGVMGLKTFFCSNACSAVRCSIFNKLDGFKMNVIVNEDMLFAAKAILHDYSVYYSASAKVYHSHPFSLLQTFKRYFNIGRFFADNKWILKHAGLNNYSGDMLKAGVKTFWKERMLYCIVALFVEFTIKAIACKLGWYYHLLFRKKHSICL